MRLLALLVAGGVAVGTPESRAGHHFERPASTDRTSSSEPEHSRHGLQSEDAGTGGDAEEQDDATGHAARGRVLEEHDDPNHALRKWPVVFITGTQLAWFFYAFHIGM